MGLSFVILIGLIIVFVGFFFRGLLGFGNAIIIAPLLSLFIGVGTVVPVNAFLSLFGTTYLFLRTRKKIDREFWFVMPFMVAGALIGTYLLIDLDISIVEKLLGFFVIIFGLHLYFNFTVKKISRFWGGVAGIFGGISDGLFSIGGPPIVVYFGNKLKKESFRATVNTIFFVEIIWLNFLFFIRGISTLETMSFSLYLLPAVFLGIYLGSKMNIKINEKNFKKIVGIFLVCIGFLIVF